MISLTGAEALSEFRQQRLLSLVQSASPDVSAIEAHYFYVVQLKSPADEAQHSTLLSLLGASGPFVPSNVHLSVNVMPRLGTRSAWSSKATNIAQRCGLDYIARIERGICYQLHGVDAENVSADSKAQIGLCLHDRMTEALINLPDQLDQLFTDAEPAPLITINLLEDGLGALELHNAQMGLALSDDELQYLDDNFKRLQRNPSDAELMMFAQANSEHCRHKIFNAQWRLDGQTQSV